MLAELRDFRDKGLTVTVLDYAVKREDVAYCIRRSTASGLVPFVSVHDLDSPTTWDDAEPPGKPAVLRRNGSNPACSWFGERRRMTWA